MKKGIIITLPRHDPVTEYLSHFSKQIIEESKNQNTPCKQLKDKEANKEDFEKVAKSIGYKMIVLNGHGTAKTICGYNDKPIVEEGVNEAILQDRIIYARACEAAFSLGVKAMQNNKEGCFIGYELPFQFYCDKTWIGNPAKDNIAPLFLEPSNSIPISILKGKTAQEAHISSKKAIIKNMKKALRKSDRDSLAVAESLWNNYEGQALIGNPQAIL